MRTVGIKVLKNKLSEYVRLAAQGETIVITDREEPVAELGPPQAAIAGHADDRILADLIRRGLATPATRRDQGPPPRHPIMSFEELMKDLDESRED